MPVAEPAQANDPIYVARQVILDRRREVFAYELLYRTSEQSTSWTGSNAFATVRVVCEALLAIGLETLADDKVSFVNVDRQFLVDGIPALLPSGRLVFELGPDVTADEPVVAACQALRSNGYALALDAATVGSSKRLIELADFLKVDFSTPAAVTLPSLVPPTASRRVGLIATKIETQEQFNRALAGGYDYFQGFFFGQPVLREGRTIPAQQISRLKLLSALQNPTLAVAELESLIKLDPTLCYRVLRAVNSAAFGRQAQVHSIREAVLLLGRDAVRRWASLWALSSAASDAPKELLVMSIIRARCCEVLGGSTNEGNAASEGFLVGVCSLLDAILGLPMATVVAALPLPDRVRDALLGGDSPARQWLDCVTAHCGGEWDRAAGLARHAGVDPALIQPAYLDALRWWRELQHA